MGSSTWWHEFCRNFKETVGFRQEPGPARCSVTACTSCAFWSTDRPDQEHVTDDVFFFSLADRNGRCKDCIVTSKEQGTFGVWKRRSSRFHTWRPLRLWPSLLDAVKLSIQTLLASRQASCPTNEDETDALACIVTANLALFASNKLSQDPSLTQASHDCLFAWAVACMGWWGTLTLILASYVTSLCLSEFQKRIFIFVFVFGLKHEAKNPSRDTRNFLSLAHPTHIFSPLLVLPTI
jgi:hypothetical protein